MEALKIIQNLKFFSHPFLQFSAQHETQIFENHDFVTLSKLVCQRCLHLSGEILKVVHKSMHSIQSNQKNNNSILRLFNSLRFRSVFHFFRIFLAVHLHSNQFLFEHTSYIRFAYGVRHNKARWQSGKHIAFFPVNTNALLMFFIIFFCHFCERVSRK